MGLDLDAEVVRLIRAKVIELPTYPGIALQLQRLISAGTFGMDELVKLVESDPGLASHVVRAANSAFYRPIQPITTLPSAILRIGASELGNIAIAGTLGVQALIDGPLVALRRDSWRRSLVNALLCQQLARGRRLDPGEAFLAGLLHDFGETIAYRTFEVILGEHPEVSPRPAELWVQRAKAYHVELGMTLSADWKLPNFLAEVVARHHDEDSALCENAKLMELVQTCDVLSARLFESTSLEAAELSSMGGVSPAEHAALLHLVPKFPSLLESLDVPGTSAVPSLVSQETPPPTETPDLDLVVNIVRRGQREPYRARQFTDTTVKVRGKATVALRQLVNVEIGDFAFPATVTASCTSNDECQLELKPFALDANAMGRWKELSSTAQRRAA